MWKGQNIESDSMSITAWGLLNSAGKWWGEGLSADTGKRLKSNVKGHINSVVPLWGEKNKVRLSKYKDKHLVGHESRISIFPDKNVMFISRALNPLITFALINNNKCQSRLSYCWFLWAVKMLFSPTSAHWLRTVDVTDSATSLILVSYLKRLGDFGVETSSW